MKSLPHEGVYVRLGVSPIEGIGVFAIKPIPAGTDIFANDKVELVWVERSQLDSLLPAERKLYDDFGIRRGDKIGCPVNFDNLTPGWYCNEPAEGDQPNVVVEDDFTFRAARDIAGGDELTIRYAEFSEGDAP
jgi:uncharacterized protein